MHGRLHRKRVRAALVNQKSLTLIAKTIGVPRIVKTSFDASRRISRETVLADAVEAIFAAVYLDGGYAEAKQVIWNLMRELLANPDINLGKDPKTALQERLQAQGFALPVYTVIKEQEDMANRFIAACLIGEVGISTQGIGATKKEAELDAAGKALMLFLKQ